MNKRQPCDPLEHVFGKKLVSANWERSYDVQIVNQLLGDGLGQLVEKIENRETFLITTPDVNELYGEKLVGSLQAKFGIETPVLILDCSEETKQLSQVENICRVASEIGLGRNAVLIAMGGGVLTDLVTMASSWIRRGIGCIRIPTTLVGQVDGGIGVKGAVNFCNRKNWLGCYRSPESVLVDPAFLTTLSQDHVRQGMAEIIKMAIVRDERLFRLVEENIIDLIKSRFSKPRDEANEVIWRSILLMLEELETNLYEDKTYRRLVDFGHTFSPTIEAASGFQLPHGEAVAIDMALSTVIASELGLMDKDTSLRVLRLIKSTGLPMVSNELTLESCKSSLADAKSHRGGNVNLVVPTAIGKAAFLSQLDDIPDQVIERALSFLDSKFGTQVRVCMNAELNLVFDAGGTSLRAAVYDRKSELVSNVVTQPTRSHRVLQQAPRSEIVACLVEDVQSLANSVLRDKTPTSVSVAVAGPVNACGEILAAPTIWGDGSQQVNLQRELRKIWPNCELSVMNDVTAAGYRYLRHERDELCIVTVGSGIGNKVFVNGKPITGGNSRGGELGHLRVDNSPNAIVCDCGGVGHLGGIASGRGTLAMAKRIAVEDAPKYSASSLGKLVPKSEELTNRDIVNAFLAGDEWTNDLIKTTSRYLGQALSGVHLAVGSERFIIFGGFGLALGERYRQLLVQAAADCSWNVGQDWDAMIEMGENDDFSGLIGAGRYATNFKEISK